MFLKALKRFNLKSFRLPSEHECVVPVLAADADAVPDQGVEKY
jgi:hypothetical protein